MHCIGLLYNILRIGERKYLTNIVIRILDTYIVETLLRFNTTDIKLYDIQLYTYTLRKTNFFFYSSMDAVLYMSQMCKHM